MCQFVTVYIRMKKSLQQKRHLWEEVSFLTPEGVKAYNRVGVVVNKVTTVLNVTGKCGKKMTILLFLKFFSCLRPVLARCHVNIFLKLLHKKCFIAIATQIRNFLNRIIGNQ